MKTSRLTSVGYVDEFVMLDYHVFTQPELERFTATAMEAARRTDDALPVAQHIGEWEANQEARRIEARVAAGSSFSEAIEAEAEAERV
jgi:hypothetical protein